MLYIDKKNIFSHLDSLPFNGSMYKIGFQAFNYLPDDCTRHADVTSFNTSIAHCTTKFTQPFPTSFKSFFPSWTFGEVDLGSHRGRVTPESNYFHQTNLLILHYQRADFDTFIKNTKNAVVNHQYLNGTESDLESIEKLSKLENHQLASSHKVSMYLNFLRNETQYRDSFTRENLPKRDAMEFSDMSDLLKNLDFALQFNRKHVRKLIAFCIQGKSDSLKEWVAHFQYMKHSSYKFFSCLLILLLANSNVNLLGQSAFFLQIQLGQQVEILYYALH